jgi:hypothetical protein
MAPGPELLDATLHEGFDARFNFVAEPLRHLDPRRLKPESDDVFGEGVP